MGCLGWRTAAASASSPVWRTRISPLPGCDRTNPHEKLRGAFVPPGESKDGVPPHKLPGKQLEPASPPTVTPPHNTNLCDSEGLCRGLAGKVV